MNTILQNIQALSSSDEDLDRLDNFLTGHEENLVKNAAKVYDALAQLDPKTYTLGWAHLLAAASLAEPTPRYIGSVRRFFVEADVDQLRMAAARVSLITRRLAEVCLANNDPRVAIVPLRSAVLKLRPTSEHLTAAHADFVCVCLKAKCYTAAVGVLEDDILSVDVEGGVDPLDLLRYFYYGAMVYMGLKRYADALELFTLLFTVPAHAVSAVMIEAYKKFVLCALIVKGSVPTLPRQPSNSLQRFSKALCVPYNEMATAYKTGSVKDVNACIELNAEKLIEDNNLGLAKQVLKSLYKRNIQKLTQTYITLSLADIAETVGLEDVAEAERYVLHMIEDNEIYATINQRDGMVEFSDDPEHYNTTRTRELIDSQIRKCVDLSEKLKAIDNEISVMPQYIFKTQMSDRSAARWQDEDVGGFEEEFGSGKGVSSSLQSFLNKQ